MTRTIFLAAILAGRLVQGEAKPVERWVIVPACIVILALVYGGILP